MTLYKVKTIDRDWDEWVPEMDKYEGETISVQEYQDWNDTEVAIDDTEFLGWPLSWLERVP
jgi:hypothetical protein